jgi:hypothetical protein
MSLVWAAITAKQRDKAFFEYHLDRIDDLVSKTIKSNHPYASQLTRTHTQAWQESTTNTLGPNATVPSPTPAISIVFQAPCNEFKGVDDAHKGAHGVSRLTSVNTSRFVSKSRNSPSQSSSATQWMVPASGSVAGGRGTSRGDGASRRTGTSGRFSLVNAESLARRLKEVDDDGYSGDEGIE